MKRIGVMIILWLALHALNAQPFPLDTLLYNGAINERINCVILGDGYLNSQLPNFLNDANKAVNYLFSATPFKQYRNYFNVFAIPVSSNVEGAAADPSHLIDNYFGSSFNVG